MGGASFLEGGGTQEGEIQLKCDCMLGVCNVILTMLYCKEPSQKLGGQLDSLNGSGGTM